MLNCGITGSSGLLGSNIIKNLKFNFIIFKGDITKKKDVENWIKSNEFDFILHLAAIVPTKDVDNNYRYAKKVNYNGTKNLVDSIIRYKKKIKSIFFASTSHVYKIHHKHVKISENQKLQPYSKYGKTKLLAENYFRKHLKQNKIKHCIGRIFSYTELKQDKTFLVPSLLNKIKKSNKKVLNFKRLNHYRDFLSIKDISNAIKILCLKNKTGVYNIGSGKKFNLQKVAIIFCKKFNKRAVFIKSSYNPTHLISNNQKLCRIGWKPKIDFIKELNKFN